jgi:hypothetical protein
MATSDFEHPSRESHTLTSAVPDAPEERSVFRLAQLILLLEIADFQNVSMKTVDRIGLLDFLSANPFIVASGDDSKDRVDRLKLRLAGFSERQLSYASTGERFVSRRRRIQHDMALLVSYGLVTIEAKGYKLTSTGARLATELTSMYADSYREAAAIVLKRLGRLSDKRLTEQSTEWLGRSWLLIDFTDDVAETVPSRRFVKRARRRIIGREQ